MQGLALLNPYDRFVFSIIYIWYLCVDLIDILRKSEYE